ncbi:hypothetical protein FGB62_37g413 [Gracilaria domingensis]|nr:hypothetical protein FGB62_37g413 [Gracilaria domingensis]
MPQTPPTGSEDIKMTLTELSRPPVLHEHEEDLIDKAIRDLRSDENSVNPSDGVGLRHTLRIVFDSQ